MVPGAYTCDFIGLLGIGPGKYVSQTPATRVATVLGQVCEIIGGCDKLSRRTAA